MREHDPHSDVELSLVHQQGRLHVLLYYETLGLVLVCGWRGLLLFNCWQVLGSLSSSRAFERAQFLDASAKRCCIEGALGIIILSEQSSQLGQRIKHVNADPPIETSRFQYPHIVSCVKRFWQVELGRLCPLSFVVWPDALRQLDR